MTLGIPDSDGEPSGRVVTNTVGRIEYLVFGFQGTNSRDVQIDHMTCSKQTKNDYSKCCNQGELMTDNDFNVRMQSNAFFSLRLYCSTDDLYDYSFDHLINSRLQHRVIKKLITNGDSCRIWIIIACRQMMGFSIITCKEMARKQVYCLLIKRTFYYLIE